MPNSKFRVLERLEVFWSQLQTDEFKSRTNLLYFAGWLVSSVLFFLTAETDVGFFLWLLLAFFWFKLVGEFYKSIRPPNEILVGLFILLYLIEGSLLGGVSGGSAIQGVHFGLSILQSLVVSFLSLLFSLILVQNSGGKKGVLFGYALLAVIGIALLRNGSIFYLIALQVVLFMLLLRKTTWLEELSKTECWIYLVVVFFVFRAVSDFWFFGEITSRSLGASVLWARLPHFFYLLIKMYLLAVLVKVPIVLVYNFARLSRKLKISSLFQSTFPQIIQLVILLMIFYFFIGGWQAEKVRQAIVRQAEEMLSGKSAPLHVRAAIGRGADSSIRLEGYEPFVQGPELPKQGVLQLVKTVITDPQGPIPRDYFLFSKVSEGADTAIYFVKIDSSFLQKIANSSSILAGSLLLAYPFAPPGWEAYIYNKTFWHDEQRFSIFPFGPVPSRLDYRWVVPLNQVGADGPDWAQGTDWDVSFDNQFTVGRMITPVLNPDASQAGFFAFEVLFVPGLAFFTRTLSIYLLCLILIYGLINSVVIRRMAKFGSEINDMIVQKVTQLKNGIREISAGNLDYKIRVEGADEFVELADRFNEMGGRLQDSIAEAREKERLQHELTIARKVQLDLLPKTLPKITGYDVAAMLKTATEVGGDFYDVIPLDDDRFLFAIGDVSGKSTSAAFYMAQCISLIRYSPQFTSEPREIGLRLNRYFSGPMVDRKIFVTAILGVLDIQSGELRFVRLGHSLPILLPGDERQRMRELKSNGLGIGLERGGQIFEESLEDCVIPLNSGDSLVLFTDGVVEAAVSNSKVSEDDGEKQFYGEERFSKRLSEARGKDSSEVLTAVTADLDSFYGGQAPVDDYTLLVVQKKGSSPKSGKGYNI